MLRAISCGIVGAFLFAAPAAADTRTFVIANAPDGYGVDQCLATGARCGSLIADAYCQSHDYLKAASFRKVEVADMVAAIKVAEPARRESAAFVAIECAR